MVSDFRGKLPQSEGIILRPQARKSIQQILKKNIVHYPALYDKDDRNVTGVTEIVLDKRLLS